MRSQNNYSFLLEYVINHTSSGVLISDPTQQDNPIIYVNSAVEKITGYSHDELIGKNCRFLQQNDTEQIGIANLRRAIIEKISTHTVLRNYRKDGSMFWNEIFLSPIFDEYGNLTHFFAITNDITFYKETEHKMFELLQKERELNDFKSRFVSMTSHQFRTPLAVIQSSLEMISRYWSKFKKQIPEEVHHKFDSHRNRIDESATRMRILLDDVMTTVKAETGKLAFNPNEFYLDVVCLKIVEDVQVASHCKGRIIVEIDEIFAIQKVKMDHNLVYHILNNLLSNALKYSMNRPPIEFNIELDRNKNEVCFTIKDFGIGIPQNELQNLFNSYFRCSNAKNIVGTGLGLSIVKQAIELHQGQIRVLSEEGKFTTFFVRLPIQSHKKS